MIKKKHRSLCLIIQKEKSRSTAVVALQSRAPLITFSSPPSLPFSEPKIRKAMSTRFEVTACWLQSTLQHTNLTALVQPGPPGRKACSHPEASHALHHPQHQHPPLTHLYHALQPPEKIQERAGCAVFRNFAFIVCTSAHISRCA